MCFFPPDGFYHIFLGFLQVFLQPYPGTLKFHDLTFVFFLAFFPFKKSTVERGNLLDSFHSLWSLYENPRVSRVAAGIPDAGTSRLLVENHGGPCRNGGFSGLQICTPDLQLATGRMILEMLKVLPQVLSVKWSL